MATKSAAPKAAEKASAPKSDSGTAALRKEIAGVKEAVRRLASGAVVTEEQRNELYELLEGK